tara:strand:+ start:2773 stop:3081 length:309 start_codon:yes stop_codon:yes gene_type:complete
MERDEHKTDMVFRVDTSKEFKGDVFVLFPHEVADFYGGVVSYQHLGQHSAADYVFCMGKSRKATEEEFAPLKKEIESLGYNVNLVSKRNYEKYLNSYKKRRL